MKIERIFSRRVFLVCLLALIWLGAAADAATYYVAKTGSDGSSCKNAQNVATPKKTINAGLSCLSSGDTLVIKGGVYEEQIVNRVPSGTSWTNATTIKAASGETVILKPTRGGRAIAISKAVQYIIFDSLTIDGSNLQQIQGNGRVEFANGSGARHIVFQNGELRNVPSSAIVVGTGTSDIRIINNKIHHITGLGDSGKTGSHGIYWRSSDGLIEGNEIYNVTGFGIQIYSSHSVPLRRNVLRKNVIYNANNKGGLFLGSSAENMIVYNNIVYNSRVGISDSSNNTNKIYNNTIYNIKMAGITNSTKQLKGSIKNNIFYKVGSRIASNKSNITSDPHFVDATKGNFRLKPGSPAIDAGVTLSEVSDDITGVPRFQGAAYDIGAHEFKSQSATAFQSQSTTPQNVPQPNNLRVVGVEP